MRRLFALLPPLALVAASACSGGGEDVPVEGDSGGDDTFVAAISAQPDQLDPHQTTAYASFQVLENVYDTLVVPSPDGSEYEPSLAEDWEVSEDGRTWTFQLRDGVTFHDGSTFDAADVVYSFDRIIDEQLGDAYKFTEVEDIVATDDSTVEFRMARPVPNLLDLIGNHKSTAILPEGAADELDLATEAVGTGPFRLTGSSADAIELEAFEDYWGEGPQVGAVEFRFVSEATTAVTGLETGEIHWTDNVPVQRIDDLESQDIEVGQVPSFDYWYMATNLAEEPFDRPEVREAIALALDRQAIADAAQFGLAEVNQTAIPESSGWYHDYAPYERDVDRARQLLDDAGVSDLSMGLMVTDEYPETVEVAEVIEANLSDVGISVSIETEQFSTWLDRQGAGDFDAFMLGWLGNIDPYGYYHSQHVCEGSNNYQGYCDRETDELLEQAAVEMDEDARRDLYAEAAERIVDANSYIYLYNPAVVHAWSSDVSGYEVRPDKAINLETVSIS
ncbi:MAG TPA: ABC transporter substrate-binding protein [Acidimicrobiales bacterium]